MTWYKRIYDLGAVFILGAFILLPFAALLIYLLINQGRPIFYVAERMRAPGRSFMLWKLRTMTVVAENPGVSGGDKAARVTPMGRFLRRTRADEIPQLWNVFRGDMSFVGPRPALFNQHDLIALRTDLGVHTLTPGLTGWAQVNGRDELPIPEKVKLDAEYVARRSFLFDVYILWLTFLKVIQRDGVSH